MPDVDYIKYKDLIKAIYRDLFVLGIQHKEINPTDKINNDEWKIAIFISKYFRYAEDYHFLRQSKNGIWYHKEGYIKGITSLDDEHKDIVNPATCYFKERTYVKTLKLKLK